MSVPFHRVKWKLSQKQDSCIIFQSFVWETERHWFLQCFEYEFQFVPHTKLSNEFRRLSWVILTAFIIVLCILLLLLEIDSPRPLSLSEKSSVNILLNIATEEQTNQRSRWTHCIRIIKRSFTSLWDLCISWLFSVLSKDVLE